MKEQLILLETAQLALKKGFNHINDYSLKDFNLFKNSLKEALKLIK